MFKVMINNMQSNTSNKLVEFYEIIENEKFSSFYKLNLETRQILREIVNNPENSAEIRNAALLENYALEFQLPVDDLNEHSIKSLPFYDIDRNFTEYFENRLKQVSNPFLLARYYHILWLENKHNNNALGAIKYYFEAKEMVIKQKINNKDWSFDLLECLKRSFIIKRNIKNEADYFNIEQEIVSTISIFIEDEWGFNLCFRLLNIILLSHRYFKDILNEDLFTKLTQYANKLIVKNESFHAIRLLELIIKISEKMNYNTINLYENLGAANEARINEFNKSNGSMTYCIEAIKIYSKLKNYSKVEELKKIYEEISSNMRFGVVKTEIDTKPIIDAVKSQIAILQKLPTNDSIQFFIYDKMFIPSKDMLVSEIKKEKEGFLTSLVGGNYSIFDQRGNIVKNCSTDEEKNWYKIIRGYGWMMNINSISINLTIKELIKMEKITLEAIYNYMMNNTWLSLIFNFSDNGGNKISYTHSNILHTLLSEYFRIFYKYLSSEKLFCTDFLMFIDSMTIKIEGLIRELFTINKYPTITTNNDAGTAHEKDLNALLYDEHIKAFLDEDELLFYKYLFIEQGGLNLRNRVAHSLLLEQEYNIEYANLLFLALLRLFKFNAYVE
jgi:hypothetical protein